MHCFVWVVLSIAVAANVSVQAQPGGAQADLLSLPRSSFSMHEDFEAVDPVVLWETKGLLEIRYKGLTREDPVGGKSCFKLDVFFREDGECIWRIPSAVPLEGPMHQTIQWRTGRHNDADSVGLGYAVMFTPTDNYYRRTSVSVRGETLAGKPSEWRVYSETFMTPGWPNESIVSETRGGPNSVKVAALVSKHDVGVEMDPLIWIKGKAGQRAVVFVDDLRIDGEAPEREAYQNAVRARYTAAAAPFCRQLQKWKERYQAVRTELSACVPPEFLRSCVDAQLEAAKLQERRLDRIIDLGHADWQQLDPVIDTLWGLEHSARALRFNDGAPAEADLVHFRMRPIANTTDPPDAVPVTGGIAADLEASACRGEYEPISFAVYALRDVEDLTLEISDLQGSGTIDSGAVDPFLLKFWYRSGLYSGDPNGRWLLKELLLKDDGLVRVDTERQHNYLRHSPEAGTEEYVLCSGSDSDHLAGVRPRDADTLQPVRVDRNTTKTFWLTVQVPEDARAGIYHGFVTLRWKSEGGVDERKIPLRLTVHPFELPRSPLIHSVFNRSRLSPNPDPDINSEYISEERYEREIRNQVAHGILHPNSYDGYRVLRPALEIRRRAGVATDRFFCVDLSYHVGLATKKGEEFREKLKERIARWRVLLDEYGYGEFYVMGKDEARGPLLEQQIPAIQAIHEAGAKVWAAATHETTYGIIHEHMDLAVMAGISQRYESERWHAAGKEVFQYGGPMTEWDCPETFRRNMGLVLWRNGYDGVMHYAYRHGFTHIWNDFDNERRDHAFVLPTVDGLIDTLAWEGVREGIDDTRYLAALLDAIDGSRDPSAAAAARDFIENVTLSAIMDEVRAQIVDWILRLRG